jgi:hypothetical protein
MCGRNGTQGGTGVQGVGWGLSGAGAASHGNSPPPLQRPDLHLWLCVKQSRSMRQAQGCTGGLHGTHKLTAGGVLAALSASHGNSSRPTVTPAFA